AATREAPRAVGIGAVDEQVAVVVDAVRAALRRALTEAGRGVRAVEVVAVEEAVAVVVEPVLAEARLVGRAATGGRADTVGVVAVDRSVAVVIDAVDAVLAPWRRR